MSELAFLDRYRDAKRRLWGEAIAKTPPARVVIHMPEEPQPERVARDILFLASGLEKKADPIYPHILTPRQLARAIIQETADKHGVSVEMLMSQRRDNKTVVARHELYWRMRSQTNWSLPQIGRFLDRDHTSVLHGCRAHEARMRGEKYVEPANQKRARERWERLKVANGGRVPR